MRVLQRYCNQSAAVERLASLITRAKCSRRPVGEVRVVAKRLRVLTAAEIDRAVVLYADGGQMTDIGRELGVHEATIRLHLVTRGVAIRRPRELVALRLGDVQRWYEAGWNLERIGKQLSVSAGTVGSGLKDAGIVLRPSASRR